MLCVKILFQPVWCAFTTIYLQDHKFPAPLPNYSKSKVMCSACMLRLTALKFSFSPFQSMGSLAQQKANFPNRSFIMKLVNFSYICTVSPRFTKRRSLSVCACDQNQLGLPSFLSREREWMEAQQVRWRRRLFVSHSVRSSALGWCGWLWPCVYSVAVSVVSQPC